MPYLVRENLFISNIGDAAEILEKGSDEITHVLSMLSSSSISFFSEWRSSLVIPAKEIRRVFAGDSEFVDGSKSALSPEKEVYNMEYAGKDLKIVRMAVPLKDTEDENLLDYLDVCLDFIEDGRKNGAVLVHCFAGVSRSAAIITAYLMRSEQLSQEAALESLRQCCEFVSPNDNFLEQLKMFEEMGFKVDRGDSYNRGHKIDSSKFGADPGLPQQVESPRPEGLPDGNKNSNVAYRCKKCRRVVALQENIVDHVPGEGMSAFQWHKRRSGNPYDKSDDFGCSSIFVEPLKWMKAVEEGAIEGKLLCVHCDARLGYFNWSACTSACLAESWSKPMDTSIATESSDGSTEPTTGEG
uniref:protein-tyrosine-phosphatase n=1 Tax=Chenopodium quinoa TaxID=63459 RepID=A0A803LT14_CHEQI